MERKNFKNQSPSSPCHASLARPEVGRMDACRIVHEVDVAVRVADEAGSAGLSDLEEREKPIPGKRCGKPADIIFLRKLFSETTP